MALAASSSSSLPLSSDALVIPDSIKILALTDNDDLLQYTTDGKNTTLVENIGYLSCSSVALVGNFVYVVGGLDDNDIPTSQVVCYDITESSISFPLLKHKHQGPSLISPKFTPKLIVMGSTLFAFSSRFQHEMFDSSSSYDLCPFAAPESLPICEFLDTSSPFNKWCSLTSFPTLPSPSLKGLYAYAISSYAVQPNKDTLFLSFGHCFPHIGVWSTCYDHSKDIWIHFDGPLPFVGQGKFIDNICFGFPLGMDRHDRDYVVSYKVIVEWTFARFSFTPLTTYSLLSNSTLTYYPTFFSFELVSSRVLTTIRVKPEEFYKLELEVLELLEVEEGQHKGTSHVCSTTTYTISDRPEGAYW